MLQHEGNLEMTEQKSHRFTARYDQNQNILDGALIYALGRLISLTSTYTFWRHSAHEKYHGNSAVQ